MTPVAPDAHPPQDAVLPGGHRPLELRADAAFVRLPERQVALERVHARVLRVVVGAPQALARADDARERAGRAGDARDHGVEAERADVRDERDRPDPEADDARR